MTEAQLLVEEKVQQYLHILNQSLDRIRKLKGSNTDFINIQNAFQQAFETSIIRAKQRIEDVRNGAVWDNLVITLFGETNAGKSTIIETFRILLAEQERADILRSSKEGIDGLIIGNGESDCTQIYKEYKMTISGVPVTLIDVPGIEGNEVKYEDEIKSALNRTHYVFYVQGQNKKPDDGTAGKIKKYLRDWVKVYSIFNVRAVAASYEEEDERKCLLNESQKKIESQIKNTFTKIWGDTYMGNITIQAHLALCSKAVFAPEREDLQRGQNKLLKYFGDSESILSFSQFQTLINTINEKASNFTNEIIEANKEKHKALLQFIYYTSKNILSQENQKMAKLKQSINDFRQKTKEDFAAAKRSIKNKSLLRYSSLFDQIYKESVLSIDIDIENKEVYCKKCTEQIIRETTNNIQKDISTVIRNLNRNINKRKRSLDQILSEINMDTDSPKLLIAPSFGEALEKLDFNSADFENMVLVSITTVLTLVNSWNPIGWIIAISSILMWLLGGRNKKAEAKEEMRKQINKVKSENYQEFVSSITQICQKLDVSYNQLANSIKIDYTNIDELNRESNSFTTKINIKISKLKISDYGKM